MISVESLLLEPQKKVFPLINEIIDKYRVYRNTSEGGLGKTELDFLLAKHRGMDIICVTNKDLIIKCEDRARKYGVRIRFIITYESLRGKGEKCNHEWLTRTATGYKATLKLRKLLKEGILVIFDEHQKAKTSSTWQHRACCAVSQEVRRSGVSILSLTSNTPLGEERNLVSIPKLCGIVTHDELIRFDSETRCIEKLAFGELEDYCLLIDKEKTRAIISPTLRLTEQNVGLHYRKLITDILVPAVTVNIDPQYSTKNVIENRFYTISGKEFQELVAESNRVSRLFAIYASQGKLSQLGSVNSEYDGMQERVKIVLVVPEQIRQIRAILPKTKILIFAWRKESPQLLIAALPEFAGKIAVVNGDTPTKERETIRQKFREDNDDISIVIGNPVVCGVGNDWDDCHGARPRANFIISGSRFLEIYQASKRAHRLTSKSDTHTIQVFIKGVAQEVTIWKKIGAHVRALEASRGKKTEFPVGMVDNDEHPLLKTFLGRSEA